MNDLVKRLRDCENYEDAWQLKQDAANEIERLQNNIDKALQWDAEKDLEIERLHEDLLTSRNDVANLLGKLATVTKQRDELVAALPKWIDPNDKTQKQYLPWIGEKVLFCHDGKVYYGHHTGGSFNAGRKNFCTWDCHWMYLPTALAKLGADKTGEK